MIEKLLSAIVSALIQLALNRASIDNKQFFQKVFDSATLDQLGDVIAGISISKSKYLWELMPYSFKVDWFEKSEVSKAVIPPALGQDLS